MQCNLNKIAPIVLDYFVALDLGNCMVHNTMEKSLLTGRLQSLNMLPFLGICWQLQHCLVSVQFLWFS